MPQRRPARRRACTKLRRAAKQPSMSATMIGFLAVLLWSCLAVLTAASGAIPPFQLAAMTFAVGGLLGLAVTIVRGRLSTLR